MGRKKECLSRFHIVSVLSFETNRRVPITVQIKISPISNRSKDERYAWGAGKRKRQSRDWFKLYIWLVERVAQNFYTNEKADERRTNTIINYFRHSTENYFLLWRYLPTMFFFVVSNSCVLSLNWTSRSLKIGCKGKNANHRRVIHSVTFMLEQTKTDGDDSCS